MAIWCIMASPLIINYNIFAPERGTVDPEVVKIVMHEEAIAIIEREQVPMVGPSIDRRSIALLLKCFVPVHCLDDSLFVPCFLLLFSLLLLT